MAVTDVLKDAHEVSNGGAATPAKESSAVQALEHSLQLPSAAGHDGAPKLKIVENASQLIGETPMVYLNKIAKSCKAKVAAKLEYLNPAGSVKDRIAKQMIEAAEAEGRLTPGKSVLVELTSGNTGIGLAAIAAMKGYRCIIIMPDMCSMERRQLMLQLGAELVLVNLANGIQGFFDMADEVMAKTPNAFYVQQFENPHNPRAHFEHTGPEIWRDTCGQVDIFVAGAGTGGTVTGVGQYLKSQKPGIKIVVLEPTESPLLSGGTPGKHLIQGIGPPIIPPVLDTTVYDEVVHVHSNDAIATAQALAREEGLLVGISAGAAAYAAMQLGAREENAGKLIVTIFPSLGERYLSTELYEEVRNRAASLVPQVHYEPPSAKSANGGNIVGSLDM